MAAPAKRHRRKSTVIWDRLPEPIIQDIQSCLLHPRDVLRTSLLSKAWHNAWFTIPSLRFKESAFIYPGTESGSEIESSKFRKLVDDTVARYDQNNRLIETFDISIDNIDKEMASLCKKWVKVVLAAGKGLKEISVFGRAAFSKHEPRLSFPRNPMIECRSLLVLRLYYVRINEQVIHKLLSTCRLLEEVCLYSCKGFEKIQVKDLHSLRVFDISLLLGTEMLQIDNAPSLQKFSYGISPSKEPGFALKIDASENLRSLELDNVAIGDKRFNKLIAKFPVLRCLAIKRNNFLEKINISCDSLTELRLSWCEKLMHVEVHSATLCELSCDGGSMLPTFSFPNVAPKQLHTLLHNPCPLRLWEVVKVTHKLEITFRLCYPMINYDWRKIALPPQSVEELVIGIDESISDTYASKIMEALFSICHPKYVCASWDESGKNDFCKFLWRNFMVRPSSCCISFDKKCWWHYLKGVQLGLLRKGDSTSEFNMREMEPLKFPWRCLLDLLDASKRPQDCLIYKLTWWDSVEAKED